MNLTSADAPNPSWWYAHPVTVEWTPPICTGESPPVTRSLELTLSELEVLKDGIAQAIKSLEARKTAFLRERDSAHWPWTADDIDVLVSHLEDQMGVLQAVLSRMS